MNSLFLVICVTAMAFGLSIIVASLVSLRELKKLDRRYEATYEDIMVMLRQIKKEGKNE